LGQALPASTDWRSTYPPPRRTHGSTFVTDEPVHGGAPAARDFRCARSDWGAYDSETYSWTEATGEWERLDEGDDE
jgi:hypothetical protein